MIQADAAQFLTSLLGSQLYLAYLAVVLLITTVLAFLPGRALSGGSEQEPKPKGHVPSVGPDPEPKSKEGAPAVTVRRRAAIASLLALRLTLAAIWWAALSVAALSTALPGLERFAGLIGLLLFAWALLGERYGTIAEPVLAGALVIASLGLLATLAAGRVLTAGGTFNRTIADAAWTALSLAAALGATALLNADPRRSSGGWSLGITGTGILAGGFGLHLVLGPSGDDFPAFVRLSELAAYPMLCLALLTTVAAPSPPVATQTSAAAAEATSRPGVLIELVGLAIAEDTRELARRLVRAVGRAVAAEVCLLLTPPNDEGRFEVVGGYDLIQEREVAGATLDRKRSPVLAAALAQRRPATLPGRGRAPDSGALRGALRLPSAGPALLAPLECDGRMFGGLLLLSPYTRKDWTEEQKTALLGIAPLLGRRLLQMEKASRERRAARPRQVGPGETPAPRIEEAPSDGAMASGQGSAGAPSASPLAEDDPFHRLAFELQLALRELAEARARLGKNDAARRPEDGGRDASSARRDLAAMAHNLRQPVSSGLGYADLLLGESVGLLGAVQKKFLERVRDGLHKVDEQLHELARAAAPDQDKPAAAPPPIGFAVCLEQAMARAAGALRARGQTVQADVPSGLPPVIVERNALTQILEHLLVHASGASLQGAAITLRAGPQPPDRPAFLQCVVTDRGAEPAAAHGSSPAGAARGEEAGDLTMVKALAEAAGGRVWVDRASGGGTSISVLLPIAPPETPAPAPAQP